MRITFDIDKPGKDSYELRKGGARQVLIAMDRRRALTREYAEPKEPRLDDLVAQLVLDAVDLVLGECLRHASFWQIELHRPPLKHPLVCLEDASAIAVATDVNPDTDPLPRLDLNKTAMIGDFVLKWRNAHSHDCTN